MDREIAKKIHQKFKDKWGGGWNPNSTIKDYRRKNRIFDDKPGSPTEGFYVDQRTGVRWTDNYESKITRDFNRDLKAVIPAAKPIQLTGLSKRDRDIRSAHLKLESHKQHQKTLLGRLRRGLSNKTSTGKSNFDREQAIRQKELENKLLIAESKPVLNRDQQRLLGASSQGQLQLNEPQRRNEYGVGVSYDQEKNLLDSREKSKGVGENKNLFAGQLLISNGQVIQEGNPQSVNSVFNSVTNKPPDIDNPAGSSVEADTSKDNAATNLNKPVPAVIESEPLVNTKTTPKSQNDSVTKLDATERAALRNTGHARNSAGLNKLRARAMREGVTLRQLQKRLLSERGKK